MKHNMQLLLLHLYVKIVPGYRGWESRDIITKQCDLLLLSECPVIEWLKTKKKKAWKPRCLEIEKMDTFSHSGTYRPMFIGLIHNGQELETTQTSFYGWMVKLWYLHTMEYHSFIKSDELLTNWKHFKEIALSKERTSKWNRTHNSTYVTTVE